MVFTTKVYEIFDSIRRVWRYQRGNQKHMTKCSLNMNEYLYIIRWHFSYHMSYQPETPILPHGPKARELIWVEGWYGMWHEKCHIITYLSYTSMRLSSYLWELIVFRNHVASFGIWCNNVILYLRFYYMYLETVILFIQQHKMIQSLVNKGVSSFVA